MHPPGYKMQDARSARPPLEWFRGVGWILDLGSWILNLVSGLVWCWIDALLFEHESDDDRVVIGSAVGGREVGVDVHHLDLGTGRQGFADQDVVEDL